MYWYNICRYKSSLMRASTFTSYDMSRPNKLYSGLPTENKYRYWYIVYGSKGEWLQHKLWMWAFSFFPCLRTYHIWLYAISHKCVKNNISKQLCYLCFKVSAQLFISEKHQVVGLYVDFGITVRGEAFLESALQRRWPFLIGFHDI